MRGAWRDRCVCVCVCVNQEANAERRSVASESWTISPPRPPVPSCHLSFRLEICGGIGLAADGRWKGNVGSE